MNMTYQGIVVGINKFDIIEETEFVFRADPIKSPEMLWMIDVALRRDFSLAFGINYTVGYAFMPRRKK